MRTDVIIVGAGIVGSSIAYELAKEGLRVVVVDRGEVGREASWAAGGILTPIHLSNYPPDLVRMCQEAQAIYPGFVSEIETESGIDVEYRETGLRVLARDEADRKVVEALRLWKSEHGQPVEDRPDGIFLPDVHQVRNHRLTRAIAAAAVRKGAEFRTQTEVTGFLKVPGKIHGVRTGQGDLQAEVTVLAAGAWSGELGGLLGISVPVRPVKGQMLLLGTEPDSIPNMILHREEYVVPRADGKVLVGSTVEEAGFDKSVTVRSIRFLLQRAVEICPELEEAPLLGTWAGLRPGSPDRMPLIGAVPDLHGLFLATGHYRIGILLGPLTGRIMRDEILRRSSESIASS
jgi:glycine oxidase